MTSQIKSGSREAGHKCPAFVFLRTAWKRAATTADERRCHIGQEKHGDTGAGEGGGAGAAWRGDGRAADGDADRCAAGHSADGAEGGGDAEGDSGESEKDGGDSGGAEGDQYDQGPGRVYGVGCEGGRGVAESRRLGGRSN